jgi:hypothetical protein
MVARVYDTGRRVRWACRSGRNRRHSSASMTSCTWARKVGRAPPQRGPAPSHRAHRQLSPRPSFGQFDLHRGVSRRPYHATTGPPLCEKERPGRHGISSVRTCVTGPGCRGRSGGRSWGRVELRAPIRTPLAVVGCQALPASSRGTRRCRRGRRRRRMRTIVLSAERRCLPGRRADRRNGTRA